MVGRRPTLNPRLQEEVMIRSRRRCCLCVFYSNLDVTRPGQIAHLDRNPANNDLSNLVYLCLEHHDAYDSKTSQSKGYLAGEVRAWRDKLWARYPNSNDTGSGQAKVDLAPDSGSPNSPQSGSRPWRFPLWQVEDEFELFAYMAANGMDGVCLIERIDLPDGRTVVACLQAPGNPGVSITNNVEWIATQVCERFGIAADRMVWLEHYPWIQPDEWDRVFFAPHPPHGDFANPEWIKMTPLMWSGLRLAPEGAPLIESLHIRSNLKKLFVRPPDDD